MLGISLYLLLSLTLNIAASVGVIFVNKRLVFVEASFHFGTALTVIHFLVSFFGCLLFSRLGFFAIKRLTPRQVLPISLAFCGYVAFNNLSLLHNTVSVYQISKILCTPTIVLIERLAYRKHESLEVYLTLIPICAGLFVTFYTEPQLNWVGSLWAVAAIAANSIYTIWGQRKQQELEASPLQLLTYQAPLSAVLLIVMIPLFDPMTQLVEYQHTRFSLMAILVSCVFAFGVNFSFFLFVGQTSPLTMNVVGYLKTALVFVGGFIFMHEQPTTQNICGIALTLFGLALYTAAKLSLFSCKDIWNRVRSMMERSRKGLSPHSSMA